MPEPDLDLDLDLDLARPRHVHVVGVGGSGMSAIASVLTAMGHRVSGSDLKDSTGLDRLREAGVAITVGHAAENLEPGTELVATSTAIPPANPEVVAAHDRGVPVLRRAEVLAAICATRRTIAVAGTHGKTTTSSMLALVLVEAGLRPSFIIGGDVTQIGSGAAWDEGEWFVVEADESDGTFVELPRAIAVVTNVEPDHLEHYGGFAPLEAAFERFVVEAEQAVVCLDDDGAARLAAATGATTYGTSEGADFRMLEVEGHGGGTRFEVRWSDAGGSRSTAVSLPVPGLHNARNACGAFAAGVLAGADPSAAANALGRFAGVARRFESRGEVDGITFVDDYAHLPTEVAAAIEAARAGSWDRVVCAFQPHRYSRTAALWQDFADAFEGVDVVALTDVYGAGEQPRPGVTGKLLVDAVLDAHPWHRVAYLPRRDDLVRFLVAELRPGDLCLSLGAGDITSLASDVQEALAQRVPASA